MNQDSDVIIADATCEWLHDHRIAFLTIASQHSPEISAAFHDFVLALHQNWPTPLPILVVYNTLKTQVRLTSYDRQRTRELNLWLKEQQRMVRSVILIKRSFTSHILYRPMETFINREHNPHGHRIRTRFFYDLDKGMAWLKEALPKSAFR